MSSTIYRIAAQTVKLTDSRRANLMVPAYQPYISMFRNAENHRMYMSSGAPQSERMVRAGRITGLVALGRKVELSGGTYRIDPYPGSEVYELVKNESGSYALGGSFWDYLMGDTRVMTEIPGVKTPGETPQIFSVQPTPLDKPEVFG